MHHIRWYLEWVKPGFEQPIHQVTYQKTLAFFDDLLQLLHPFMPFITEEVYHQLQERKTDLTVSLLPPTSAADRTILHAGDMAKQLITALRDARNKYQLKPKDPVKLHIESADTDTVERVAPLLQKQANALSVTTAGSLAPLANSLTVVVGKQKIYIETTVAMDTTAQKEKLLKDLDYQKGFLASVEKKLKNEKFVQQAQPSVIENERKKQADALTKIRLIEESLQSLE